MCEDCAFSREHGCVALSVKQCMIGKPCSFYKTQRDLEIGRAKAEARIASLSKEEIDLINHVYHGYKPRKEIDSEKTN